MVKRGNPWQPRANNGRPFKFCDYSPSKVDIKSPNMPQTSKSLLSPIKWMATMGNQFQWRTMTDLLGSEMILYSKWVQHLKICIKLQMLYYHLLTEWLLMATNGNKGQTMMDLWSFETIIHARWVQYLIICLKLQSPHHHLLNEWLLEATMVTLPHLSYSMWHMYLDLLHNINLE